MSDLAKKCAGWFRTAEQFHIGYDRARKAKEAAALAAFIERAQACHDLMVRPAHVGWCGAYKNDITRKVDFTGTCTCGVDETSRAYLDALRDLAQAMEVE